MNWIMWVGAGLVVLLLIVLIMPSGKNKGSPPDPNRPKTSVDVSAEQRAAWAEAEEAVAAYAKARGDEVGPAREHMLRVADDVRLDSPRLTSVAMSERQARMWALAAEHIREFVNDALARHPEDQQR